MNPKLAARLKAYVRIFVMALIAILAVLILTTALIPTPFSAPGAVSEAQRDPHGLANPAVLPPGVELPTVDRQGVVPQGLAVQADEYMIIYASEQDGNWNIYKMSADGSGQTRLTDDPAYEQVPRYSSAAAKIAYDSDVAGNRDIYVMDVDGGNPTRLTSNPGDEFWPQWSPDGTQIAYTHDLGGKTEIYVMDANGDNQRRLTTNDEYSEYPTWSPDGTKIAFQRSTDPTRLCDVNWDIYVIDLNTLAQTQITTNSLGDHYPSWSHANGKISYSGCESEGSGWGTSYISRIWVMNADGSNKVKLTTDIDFASMWSPDGSKIVFVSARDGLENEEIYVMTASGSDETNVTNLAGSNQTSPDWGPIHMPPPVAEFSAQPRSGDSPLEVTFTDQSLGEVTSWLWNLGNGVISTAQNPVYTYTQEGKYTVVLTATGPGGSGTETKVDYIQVTAAPGLAYVGPLFLPEETVVLDGIEREIMPDENDSNITMGDHVTLRLYFRNTDQSEIPNAFIEIRGREETEDAPGVWILDSLGGGYAPWQVVSLSTPHLAPGAIGWADVTLYVSNIDAALRSSLNDETWFTVKTLSGEWKVSVVLQPVRFSTSQHLDLIQGSCLHDPQHFEIQRYAQFAVGSDMHFVNGPDPDTADQAVRNLIRTVNDTDEFRYHEDGSLRVQDTVLLQRRFGQIGACRHFADLAAGLLRSLGIPTRYVTALLRIDIFHNVGHAWVEVFLESDNWVRADPTAGQVGPISAAVIWAKADKNPLSSASSMVLGNYYLCIPACFQPPVICDTCVYDSNWCPLSNSGRCPPVGWLVDPPCVENVTPAYRDWDTLDLAAVSSLDLAIEIEGPILVTRTVPFSIVTNISNTSIRVMDYITVTVPPKRYLDSPEALWDADPAFQVITDLAPGQSVSLTWTITPAMAGSLMPLRIEAESGDSLAISETPLIVQEPGALPPLTARGMCGLGTVHPGETLSLTVSLVDEAFEPVIDGVVTATVYSTPTAGYEQTWSMVYSVGSERYEQAITLPADAPIGSYAVDYAAAHLGHAPAGASSTFFVAPELTMVVQATPGSPAPDSRVILTARVYDRGWTVKKAGVYAEILTPGGMITVPLEYNGDHYAQTFRPMDLEPNLGQPAWTGLWTIRSVADYYGGRASAWTTLTVVNRVYLPIIVRNSH